MKMDFKALAAGLIAAAIFALAGHAHAEGSAGCRGADYKVVAIFARAKAPD